MVDVYPRHKAADVYLSFGRSCVVFSKTLTFAYGCLVCLFFIFQA